MLQSRKLSFDISAYHICVHHITNTEYFKFKIIIKESFKNLTI